MNFVEEIKSFYANFPKYASQPIEVNDESQYSTADQWIKRVNKIFRKQLIIYLILAFALSVVFFVFTPIHPLLKISLSLLYVLLFGWCAIGTATIKLYKKEVFNKKSMLEWGKAGYNIGKQVETTHVNLTHEFGDTYRVSTYTENKGCLFTIIALLVRYMIFATYCMFKGLPLTFKKYRRTRENMMAYRSTNNA